MTRRERLERKLEKRETWADKARERSGTRLNAAARIADAIPMGQPVLVGHHSERHHRRDLDRIDANMRKGVEEAKLAEHHDAKRRGLEIQLDRTIFDDDPDAIERLEARIAEREASADLNVKYNKAWRKGGVEALIAAGASQKLAETTAETVRLCPWLGKSPFSSAGDRAAIRKDRERIELIKRKRERAQQAEAAPGGVLVEGFGEWVRVTFPEKPSRDILVALRAAGFRWGGGCWSGPRAKLPEGLQGAAW